MLEASNQISLLEPWFANTGKRLVKSPKIYLNDSGLCSFLLGVTPTTLAQSPFLGSLWEGFIYSELRKVLASYKNSLSLWYYRDDRQLEIDFMVVGGGHGELIEVKWTEFPDSRDVRPLRELMQQVQTKGLRELATTKGWVICRTPERFPVGDSPLPVEAMNVMSFMAKMRKDLGV